MVYSLKLFVIDGRLAMIAVVRDIYRVEVNYVCSCLSYPQLEVKIAYPERRATGRRATLRKQSWYSSLHEAIPGARCESLGKIYQELFQSRTTDVI